MTPFPLTRNYYVGIAAFFAALGALALMSVGSGAAATDRYLPHGVCYQWQPNLVRLHVMADALIGLAYVAIPFALVSFVRKRADLPFNWMFLLFGVFIVACGATHWMEVWTLWNPNYWLSGGVKALTAAASIPTAILLFVLIPKAVALPSVAQLVDAKLALEEEVRERLKVEAQLEDARRRLEARVRERTAELATANEVLESQRAELERANRIKSDFLAVLSHELRNPIHAIRTSAWVIRAKAAGTDLQRTSQSIDRQVAKLSRLLDDLLDVVAVSRTSRLEVQTLDLRDIAHAALETTRQLFEQKAQRVEASLPAGAVYVRADPARLEQAVANVLNNASKYTGEGGTVTIELGVADGNACIKVRDTGVGIAPEELPRIFELFGRGEASKRSEGLGIGLYIANELLNALGGSITARSGGPGQGTEFILSVPLAPAGTVPAAVRGEPPPSADRAAPALRVLVVDDNRDAADTLRELLEMAGHQAVASYEGHDALRKARVLRPQVALVDIGLPTLSGYEVARALKAVDPEVLAVAITGWGADDDKRRAGEAGFDHHLTKPVDPEHLARLLAGLARRA